MTPINPDRLTFEEGLERIRQESTKAGFELERNIVTSRSEEAESFKDILQVSKVLEGFRKLQLPVHFACESQTFISFAVPNTRVPALSHKEGPGIRIIISGSMKYEGVELVAGDWMYIPAGKEYDFTVGPSGVAMFSSYCCCSAQSGAGRAD